MFTKKPLTFGKILALLLLISFSVVSKAAVTTNEFQNQRKVSVSATDYSFHKNMLQPQVVHVSMVLEHSAKPLQSGAAVLFYSDIISLPLQPLGQIQVSLQDVNRCESVSKLLFPFHYFW